MPAIAKCIRMRQVQKAAIRIWVAQKGAQHKDTSGRGWAWYAAQNYYYGRYQSRLHAGWSPDRRAWCWYLLADRGYDSNAIIEQARRQGIKAVIPPKKNRTAQRFYDKELYKLRHLVENAFLHLKRWRGIATRYAKNTATFLTTVQIRCIALWANISWLHYLAKIWQEYLHLIFFQAHESNKMKSNKRLSLYW